MKKAMLATMLLCCVGWLTAAYPVKIDVGTSNTANLEPGWQDFTSTDNGTTVYDGFEIHVHQYGVGFSGYATGPVQT